MPKDQLKIHEYIFGWGVCLFFGLILINGGLKKRAPAYEKVAHLQDYVRVKVVGDVEEPGVYQVKKGTSAYDVIRMAIPKEISKVPLRYENQVIRRGRTIKLQLEKNDKRCW